MTGEMIILVGWTTVIAVLTLVAVRETALLQARVAHSGRAVGDGWEVGTLVPGPLRGRAKRQVALFLSATCPPCHELAAQLGSETLSVPLTPVISGEESVARALAAQLPGRPSAIVGHAADALTERAGVRLQPFAIAIEDGIVVAKTYPVGAESVTSLLEPR